MTPPPKTCFVIGPIGKDGTEARTRADALLKHIVKKVLEAPPFGMAVTRADEMEPGLITHQIIERVVNADLVVADLTDRNANAHYELALRHVTRKPIVHMLQAGQTLPFDITHQRTVFYDTSNLDAAEQAKEDLAKHADAVLKDPEAADNPITAALLVLGLAKSRDTTDQTLARILTAITELREDLRLVQDREAEKVRRETPSDPYRLREFNEALAMLANLRIPAPSPVRAPIICAACGQPIVGPVSQSSDNKPIHRDGKCPPPEGGLLSALTDR